LTIGRGNISADTMLQLYAGGSNGTIIFKADVTLNGGSMAAIIAANTVNILDNVTVTISGPIAALVYTNNPNYSIVNGGNNSAANAGKFGGAGATTNPYSGAPPFNVPSARGSIVTSSLTKSGRPPRGSRPHPSQDTPRHLRPNADPTSRNSQPRLQLPGSR
jgi:hypothetical protein